MTLSVQKGRIKEMSSSKNGIYALIEVGGKQYKVSPGDIIQVELLSAEEGSTVELDRVVLLAEGEKVTPGRPFVEEAKVIATVLGEVKGEKIVVFKYKSKVRYRKKTGHRQRYTRLEVKDIVTAASAKGGEVSGPQKRRRKHPVRARQPSEEARSEEV